MSEREFSEVGPIEFEGNWPQDVKEKFLADMTVIDNFITPEDENALMEEIEPYLKRMRYERDHWDDAIQGFRETERKSWYPKNKEIINRVITKAFPNSCSTLPHIHVLDLEATGKLRSTRWIRALTIFFNQDSSSLTLTRSDTAAQRSQACHCYQTA